MRILLIVFFLAFVLATGICPAGEQDSESQPVVEVSPVPVDAPPAPDSASPEPSNWEKFKTGARLAGEAVASGARHAADKTADAVTHGAKKTGEFFSDGYHDAKEYIHEKTE